MPAKPKRKIIHGSEKLAMPGARSLGPIDDNERLEVTVKLRPKKPLEDLSSSNAFSDTLPRNRTYMSRDELNAIHGADPKDIAKIKAFARAHKLIVVEANAGERRVVLSGTTAAFSAAFDTKIEHFESPDGTYRGRIGALSIASDIADIVEGVFGIDNRPQARPHYQRRNFEMALH
jgi:kumamolisin